MFLRHFSLLCVLITGLPLLNAGNSITYHHITWQFDQEVKCGEFINGDPWVVGSVNIISISNNLHNEGFTPNLDQDGSMLNPGINTRQGYDGSLSSYQRKLNAGVVNDQRVSPENPLWVEPGSSLISMVSWLYKDAKNAEKGIPSFNSGTIAPRPVTRFAAILTVLNEAPEVDSFRPGYCSTTKEVHFNLTQVDFTKLRQLEPSENLPDGVHLVDAWKFPWIDHVHEYLGAMIHPSKNMPNYGRELAKLVSSTALLTNLKCDGQENKDAKRKLIIALIQLGIDNASIADAGGGWPENGGHGMGRKLPILYAGLLLNNAHMLEAGNWKTRFHDDEQTFFVTAQDVERTNSPKWDPDSRAKDKLPYRQEDIGMPEWGVRHTQKPLADNRGFSTPYRDVNGSVIPTMALAASIMDLRTAWNHEAYFEYAQRYMGIVRDQKMRGTNAPEPFGQSMWDLYAASYGLAK